MFYDSWLGIPVKLDSETCDSFISVIPAKAGIQNRSMPQKDLDTKTPWIPAFAGMTCNLTTLPRNSRFRRNPVTTTVAERSDCGDACIPPVEERDRRRNDGNKAVTRLGIQLDDNPKLHALGNWRKGRGRTALCPRGGRALQTLDSVYRGNAEAGELRSVACTGVRPPATGTSRRRASTP